MQATTRMSYRMSYTSITCSRMILGIIMIYGVTAVLLLEAKSAFCQEPVALASGIDESILDSSIQPCDDFYQFSCGKWLEHAEIPADLPMWDRSFMAIREKNREVLRNVLEKYSSGSLNQPKNPYAKKLGDFYAACMDEKAIEQNALPELKEELKKVDALNPKEIKKQLPSLLAQLHLKGVNALFDLGDQQDFKDATQVIGVVDQAGLSLPDRDYYLKDDPKTIEVRNLYLKYVQTILGLLGSSEASAKEDAQKIMKIETELAKNSMARADRRDPFKIYHRLDRKGLKEKVPHFNWDEYFTESGVPTIQSINVTYPEFFVALNDLFSSTEKVEISDLKIYLKWHWVTAMIPALPQKFVDENFAFVSQALSGQKQLEARWKRCVKVIDQQMGFALGRSFVDLSYGSEGKAMTKKMIQNVEKAFQEELNDLGWMDDPTKKQALKKLHAIVNKVGYPDVWRKYDSFKVDRKSYLRTLAHVGTFNSRYHLNKIGNPVDRRDWEMSPPTVNAYYDASMNEMVFPAGILQPPFFNQTAKAEVNYGGIGMVMGHELTHGFDDQGRHYDSVGNLVDWWSPTVAKAFEVKAECVVQQYDAYESLPGVHLNGKLTLGENIADQGGVRLAYRAWTKSHLNPKTTKASLIPSRFNEDQRFFIALAQSWCSKKQEQLARMLVKTDPHSPPRFRVNGALSQFPQFSEAFQCKPGAKMAPANRCEIW